MKKLLLFLLLAGFISACSQYTCPTYSKVEKVDQKSATEKKV